MRASSFLLAVGLASLGGAASAKEPDATPRFDRPRTEAERQRLLDQAECQLERDAAKRLEEPRRGSTKAHKDLEAALRWLESKQK